MIILRNKIYFLAKIEPKICKWMNRCLITIKVVAIYSDLVATSYHWSNVSFNFQWKSKLFISFSTQLGVIVTWPIEHGMQLQLTVGVVQRTKLAHYRPYYNNAYVIGKWILGKAFCMHKHKYLMWGIINKGFLHPLFLLLTPEHGNV